MTIKSRTHFAGQQSESLINKKLQVNNIKKAIDSLDFYTHELGKLLIGRSWIDAGICPLHVGDTSSSFHVNLNTGAYKCLRCEAEGEDIVEFTMALHGLSSLEALEKLAREWLYNIHLNMVQTCNKEGFYHAKN